MNQERRPKEKPAGVTCVLHHFPGESVADLRLLALFAAAFRDICFSETQERARVAIQS